MPKIRINAQLSNVTGNEPIESHFTATKENVKYATKLAQNKVQTHETRSLKNTLMFSNNFQQSFCFQIGQNGQNREKRLV